MYRILIALLTMLFICNCQEPQPNPWKKEVLALSTDEQKNKYLEFIYALDKEVQKGNTTRDEIERTNQTNFEKIEAYLEIHGHPRFQDHGPTAAKTPFAIIHSESSKNSLSVRKRYFPLMKQAFSDGNIGENDLSEYLNRAYVFKTGERFYMPSPFRGKDELDTLLKMLDFGI